MWESNVRIRHAVPLLGLAIFFLFFCLPQSSNAQMPVLPRGDTIFPVSCYLNVMIILDRSDSVLGGFNRSRDFVLAASEELNISPHAHSVSMITYSGNHYRREVYPWNFAKSNEEFKKVVRDIRAIGGTTNTKEALNLALKLMESRNKTIPTLVMVVTDGRSAVDPKEPAVQLQRIPDTWVFAAATGDPHLANKAELLDIAGHKYHVIMQSGRIEAEAVARKLLREAQEKCRTTTTTSTTTTTTTTTTTNPFTGCEQDLVLVFDFSTTTQPVYQDYMHLSEQLVSQLYVSPRHTRVALITFSSPGKTHTQWDLKKFKTAAQVIDGIRNVQYIGGLTSVGQGIREAAKQSEVGRGARPGLANKIMLVFTDGWQNKGPDPTEESRAAEALGFKIYSVSVVSNRKDAIPVNVETLDSIVAHPQTEHFTDQNFQQLVNIVRQRNVKCFGQL